MGKKKENPDQNPTKKHEEIEEPESNEPDMVLKEEEYEDELDELDFEMADMQAIREIVMLDPNDIEFRQRHAEVIEMDSAA